LLWQKEAALRPLFFCTSVPLRMKPDFAHQNISLWAGLLTIGLAAGWLLPNHYPPWLAFHVNAWVACALASLLPPCKSPHQPPLQLAQRAAKIRWHKTCCNLSAIAIFF